MPRVSNRLVNVGDSLVGREDPFPLGNQRQRDALEIVAHHEDPPVLHFCLISPDPTGPPVARMLDRRVGQRSGVVDHEGAQLISFYPSWSGLCAPSEAELACNSRSVASQRERFKN